MRIVNSTGQCLLEISVDQHGSPEYTFYNDSLKKDLSKGIHIPAYAQKNYQGRTLVKMDEPGFLEALQIFYVKNVLSKANHRWED